MKKTCAFLLALLIYVTGYSQTTWVIDPTHSSVQFEVPHLAVSSVTGYFTAYAGTVVTKKNDFENAKITATIETASISTNNMERDKHLKDDDFFNVVKYPEIKFASTSFEKTDNNHYTIKGNLTIRDVTKPVTMEAEFGGIVSIDNKKKAGFNAKTTINRFDYGLKWDDVLDSGGLIVGEKVDIIVKLELVKQ